MLGWAVVVLISIQMTMIIFIQQEQFIILFIIITVIIITVIIITDIIIDLLLRRKNTTNIITDLDQKKHIRAVMIDLQDRNQTPITHHEEETQGLMAIEEEMVAVIEDKIKK